MMQAYQSEDNSEERLQAIQTAIGYEEEQIMQDCESHLAFNRNNYYSFLWQFYKSHRSTLYNLSSHHISFNNAG